MIIKLELEPQDMDLIFAALQSAPLPASFTAVKALLDKMLAQGQPQLLAQAAQTEDVEKVGGTD